MEIKQFVKKDLRKIFDEEKCDHYMSAIHFYYGDGRYEPGVYVYEETGAFIYLVVGDRGGIDKKIVSGNLADILYEIFSGVTYTEASEIAMQNLKKGKDWRRTLFSLQLDMLKKVNDSFYQKRYQEIQNILLTNPYHDNL